MAKRKMVQSMKTFKTFFEDQEYDVAAKPVGKDSGYEYIGKADSQALAKITRRTHKYGSSADEKIETYLNGIGFNFPDAYRQSFELILDNHNVDFNKLEAFYNNKKGFNDFGTFVGRGDINFYEQVEDRIKNDIGVENPYGFYNDLCKVAHAQSRTAVGECEFMLAILTEGMKGKTGDIGTEGIEASGREFEIGTQEKIISKGIKDIVSKTVPTPSSKLAPGNIWDQNSKETMWTSENMNDWIFFKQNTNVKFNGLEQRCEALAKKELETGVVDIETRRRLFSSCVLHKYITSHNDNCIIIFNGGSAGRYGGSGRMSAASRQNARKSEEFQVCRWLELGENSGRDAEWVFKNCVDDNWFNFGIKSDLSVRISYRT